MMGIFSPGHGQLSMGNRDWQRMLRLGVMYEWQPLGVRLTGVQEQFEEGGDVDLHDPRFGQTHPDGMQGYLFNDWNEMIEEDCHRFASALILALTEPGESCDAIGFSHQPNWNRDHPGDTFMEGWAAVAMAVEFFRQSHGVLIT